MEEKMSKSLYLVTINDQGKVIDYNFDVSKIANNPKAYALVLSGKVVGDISCELLLMGIKKIDVLNSAINHVTNPKNILSTEDKENILDQLCTKLYNLNT